MYKLTMKKQSIYLMFAIIFLACFMQVVSSIQEPQIYYKLNLDYNKENISINSTEIEFSNENLENVFGFYFADIVNSSYDSINFTFFDVPKDVIWEGINPKTKEIDRGGILELEQVSFNIYVPYYENAKEIIIYDENLIEIVREDVSIYSKQYEKESIVNESIKKEIDKKKQIEEERIDDKKNLFEKLTEYWWILLIILIILIIILFYFLSKKKLSLK